MTFTDYDTDEAYRPDVWSGTLKPTMSLSEYTKVIDQAVDNQYKISEYRTKADNDESKKRFTLNPIKNLLKKPFDTRLRVIN